MEKSEEKIYGREGQGRRRGEGEGLREGGTGGDGEGVRRYRERVREG